METLGLLGDGFLIAFSPLNLALMLLGCSVGLIVGAMPGLDDLLQLEVEVQPVGTDFTDTPSGSSVQVSSGTTTTVTVGSLSDDTDYHWQARTVDDTGLESAWVSFGGNGEDEADFSVSVPGAPDVPMRRSWPSAPAS